MRRSAVCGYAVTLLCLAVVLALAAALPARASTTPLVVGVMRDLPPYESVSPDGVPTGYHVDLVRAAAREMGLAIEFRAGTWAEHEAGLRDGRIGLIPAMIRTPEREEVFAFSVPHTNLTYSIFVRPGTAAIATESDLAGREVLLPRGGIMSRHLAPRVPGIRMIECDAEMDPLARLAAGEGDAAVFLTLKGALFARRQGLANLVAVSPPIFSQATCFAMRRDDRLRLAALEEGLKLIDERGEPRRIYEAWFGLTPEKIESHLWRERAAAIALALLLCLALALGWLWSVRRQVRLRTEELAASREELRRLVREIETAREEERTAIARELHDDLGQALTSLKLMISLHRKACAAKCEGATGRLDEILARMDEGIRSVKTVVQRLRPPVLDDLGLAAAFDWQCREVARQSGLRVLCRVTPETIAMAHETETALFRILQEGLTNVVRHAKADRVTVLLALVEGVITFEIEDDGRGISEDDAGRAGSFGLTGIRERARTLGGAVEVKPGPEQGTVLRVTLPAATRP